MQPTRNYQFESTGCPTTNWFYPTTYEQQQKYQQLMGRDMPCGPTQPCLPPTSFEQQQQQQYWQQPQQWQQWQQQQQQWLLQQRFQQQQQQMWWNNTCCWTGCRPSNPMEFYCLTNPIRVLDREGNRMIWLCFDQRGYRPEEINVTLNRTERCITVECNQETKEGRDQIQRRFCRRFCFPEQLQKCDLSKCELRCYMNPDGQLTIECTLPRMTQEELVRYYCQPTQQQQQLQQQQWQQQQQFYCGQCPPTQCGTPVNCKCN